MMKKRMHGLGQKKRACNGDELEGEMKQDLGIEYPMSGNLSSAVYKEEKDSEEDQIT